MYDHTDETKAANNIYWVELLVNLTLRGNPNFALTTGLRVWGFNTERFIRRADLEEPNLSTALTGMLP